MSIHLHGAVERFKAGQLADALSLCDQALRSEPQSVFGRHLRGAILIKMDRHDDAISDLRRAVKLAPTDGKAHSDLAAALNGAGRFAEAFRVNRRALELWNDDPVVRYQAALINLLHGRFEQGWADYEYRPQTSTLPLPRWKGEPPDGGFLAVTTEQGLGDAIQFVRYAKVLAARGHRIVILTRPILAPLLALTGIETVVTPPAGATRWIPLMSVPNVLKTIPADVPYLTAKPRSLAGKIGIAWQGNPKYWLDKGRSLPLASFLPLAEVPGVQLVSLQKGAGTEQIAQVPFGVETLFDPADTSAGALVETAEIIAGLDMVVAPDSMIAHLAGALGVPTCVVLRPIPEWRWLLDRDDSPWYPSARIFRARQAGDWEPVMRRIADHIASSRAASMSTR